VGVPAVSRAVGAAPAARAVARPAVAAWHSTARSCAAMDAQCSDGRMWL
jgi:hypothetical protein